MGNIIQFPDRQNNQLGGLEVKSDLEAQNASQVVSPEKNVDTTVDAIQKIAESGVSNEKIVMEMPPEESLKGDSEVANSMIRDFGNNGKFGNGNYRDMRGAIVRASEDPYNLNDAIQELFEEINGNMKKAA
ncbi:hypothetical protein IKG45_03435 [Candidatus Saccharibacteria bacterium]|nr:hypothetical protein [Candidatus Saccharibacteria bacterium]